MPADAAEAARAALVELFPEGFEERAAGGALELAVYTDEAGERRLRACFAGVRSTPVAADWRERWRDFHRPVTLGSLWIGPPWRTPEPGRLAVVIDPGRAFGTGGHATTRLCLGMLGELPRGALLDLGCGSGVLAIAGARLGFAPVIAVDTDPNAVEATATNAARNRVLVEARLVDAREGTLPRADAAVMNIALAVVEAVLPRLDVPVAITSGYRAEDAFAPGGWHRVARRERGGWAADLLRRETP